MTTEPPSRPAGERRVLRIALGLNATMFMVELGAGLVAGSVGLVADSLDMLADALAYGLSLVAIGRPALFQVRVARLSGTLLLLLGIGVLADVVRRAVTGSEPEGGIMLVTAGIALAVNATVIRMLARYRRGAVHLRAAWLFTRADVVANLGVMLSAVLVIVTGRRHPDLVVGIAIGGYVIREALVILQNARQARARTHSSRPR